jgi:hypothetical protein
MTNCHPGLTPVVPRHYLRATDTAVTPLLALTGTSCGFCKFGQTWFGVFELQNSKEQGREGRTQRWSSSKLGVGRRCALSAQRQIPRPA